MPVSHDTLRRQFLTRADLEALGYSEAQVLAWLWNGQIEMVTDGPFGEQIVAVADAELRERLAGRLPELDKLALSLEPESVRQRLASPLPIDADAEPDAEDVLAEHVAEEALDATIEGITDAIGALLEQARETHGGTAEVVEADDTVRLELAEDDTQDVSEPSAAEELGEAPATDAAAAAAAHDATSAPAQTASAAEIEQSEGHEPSETPEVSECNERSQALDGSTDHASSEAIDGSEDHASSETPEVSESKERSQAIDGSEALEPPEQTEAEPAREAPAALDLAPIVQQLAQIESALQAIASRPQPHFDMEPLAERLERAAANLKASLPSEQAHERLAARVDAVHAAVADGSAAIADAIRRQPRNVTVRRQVQGNRVAAEAGGTKATTAVAAGLAGIGWLAALALMRTDLRLALCVLVCANLLGSAVLLTRRQ